MLALLPSVTFTQFSYAYDSLHIDDSFPADVEFSDDGTKMFIVGAGGLDILQYDLDDKWDVSTATYSGNKYDVWSEDTFPQDVAFSSSGDKMFVVGTSNDKVYQYNMTTAWDVSTASYSGNSHSVLSQIFHAQGVTFSSSGDKMFVVGLFLGRVHQYDLTTDWDLSTATYSGNSVGVGSCSNISIGGLTASPSGLAFSSDGDKMFVSDHAREHVCQYDLDNDWDLSTATYSGNTLTLSPNGIMPTGLAFSSDGDKMFYTSDQNDKVYQITLPDTFTIKPAPKPPVEQPPPTPPTDSVIISEDYSPTGLALSSGGDKMFIASLQSKVSQYDLNTDWDVSTASYSNYYIGSLLSDGIVPHDLTFSSDGDKMFVVDYHGDQVHQYNMTTDWDLSTASYSGNSAGVGSEDNSPTGVTFSSGGDKMFVVGLQNSKVHQYDLTTDWDLSTASYSGNSAGVGSEDNSPTGVTFSSGGDKMFVVGLQNSKVHQYDLTTDWDLSTASYSGNDYDVAPQAAEPHDLAFSDSGKKMFILGYQSDKVYQYDLSSGFTLSDATQNDAPEIISPDSNSTSTATATLANNVGSVSAPPLTVSVTKSPPNDKSSVVFEINFNQDVKDFDETDLKLKIGKKFKPVRNAVGDQNDDDASTFAYSLHQAELDQISDGDTVTLQIKRGSFTGDTGGVKMAKHFKAKWAYDASSPVPTITSSVGNGGNVTGDTVIDFTVTFSEKVKNFKKKDIGITGDASSGKIKNFKQITKSVYTFSITPRSNGDVLVSIPANTATDIAGNANVASEPFVIHYKKQ